MAIFAAEDYKHIEDLLWKHRDSPGQFAAVCSNNLSVIMEALQIAFTVDDTANLILARLDMVLARLAIVETIGARSRVMPAGEHSLKPPPGAPPLVDTEALQTAYAASLGVCHVISGDTRHEF